MQVRRRGVRCNEEKDPQRASGEERGNRQRRRNGPTNAGGLTSTQGARSLRRRGLLLAEDSGGRPQQARRAFDSSSKTLSLKQTLRKFQGPHAPPGWRTRFGSTIFRSDCVLQKTGPTRNQPKSSGDPGSEEVRALSSRPRRTLQ